jgi:hypothetical protein
MARMLGWGIAVYSAFVMIGICVFAYRFRRRQNGPNPPPGGPISVPKTLWLGYTLGNWFLLPLPVFFMASPGLSPAWKLVLGAHLASWWLRAPIELVMIYRTFNWTPTYGIVHDLLHFLMIVVLGAMAFSEGLRNSQDELAALYLAAIVVAMLFEAAFARLFQKARGAGNEDIYFADDHSPQYRFINKLTWVAVVFVYSHMLVYLAWAGIRAA